MTEKKKHIPVVRLEVRWVERLGTGYEVVRDLMVGDQVVYRVEPFGDRRWRAQKRDNQYWIALRTKPRKGAYSGVERSWASPAAAMRAVEEIFHERTMLLPGTSRSEGE